MTTTYGGHRNPAGVRAALTPDQAVSNLTVVARCLAVVRDALLILFMLTAIGVGFLVVHRIDEAAKQLNGVSTVHDAPSDVCGGGVCPPALPVDDCGGGVC